MEAPRHLGQKTSLLWMILLASPALSQDYPQVASDDECECYRTNGSDAAYFKTHQFFDFRSLSEYAGVPDIIPDEWNSSHAHATSDYFLSDKWTDNWGIQSWNNSDILAQQQADERAGRETTSDALYLLVNSPNNVYIEAGDDGDDDNDNTFLTMRTSRVGRFQSGAEFESVATGLHYLSVRMLARTRGDAGGVTAMFTYRGASDGALAEVQESDLEIRTLDPARKVQYTNQPSYTDEGEEVPEATRNATLPRGTLWTDWAVYRMDWTPTRTTHYVDGDEVAAIAFQNPRDPTQVYFNCWSDGGSWSGIMRDGRQAVLQIQWIEMVFNQTDVNDVQPSKKRADGDGGSCQKVCSIDETDTVGTAVLIEGAEGVASAILGLSGWLQLTLWIPLFTMFTIGMS